MTKISDAFDRGQSMIPEGNLNYPRGEGAGFTFFHSLLDASSTPVTAGQH